MRRGSARKVRTIQFGEIPVIRHTDELAEAAAQLATRRCAYVLPATMQSRDGSSLRENQDRVAALRDALDDWQPFWTATISSRRIVTPSSDIGMHGNPPFKENPPGFMDHLQYHYTPRGKHTVTIALGQPAYAQEQKIANDHLTTLLTEGKTMPYYADPDTFQRAALGPEDAVVFRLYDKVDGSCLLHDFQTTSLSREAVIIALEQWDLEAVHTPGPPPQASA